MVRIFISRCILICGETKTNSTPVNEQTCIFCNPLQVKGHFVSECVLYNDLKKQSIPQYYWRRPNMQKCIQIVNEYQKP